MTFSAQSGQCETRRALPQVSKSPCSSRLDEFLVLLSVMIPGPVLAQSVPLPSDLRFKAAAVAFDPAWGDFDGNVNRIVTGLEEVAKQDVRLAVLPEQATTGYIFDNFTMVAPYSTPCRAKQPPRSSK